MFEYSTEGPTDGKWYPVVVAGGRRFKEPRYLLTESAAADYAKGMADSLQRTVESELDRCGFREVK